MGHIEDIFVNAARFNDVMVKIVNLFCISVKNHDCGQCPAKTLCDVWVGGAS